MEDEPRALRELLRDREAELGISVTEAARLAGLPLRQYQKYRNNGVVPQGPQRKRLSKGLDIPTHELNTAIDVLEAENDAGEAYVKWLEAPASREDVQKLEAKIEKQLREIREGLNAANMTRAKLRELLGSLAEKMGVELPAEEEMSRDAQLDARQEEIRQKLNPSDSPSHAVSDRKSDD
jgi:transcriptional regulator with XRE-family HTH domain